MTQPTDAATKETYETAIRSFTESEIALREIVAAIQRYRAASDTVAEAAAALSASRHQATATLATLETTAASLQRVSPVLGEAASVIAALDPERFWASFSRLEGAVATSAEAAHLAAEERRRIAAQARTIAVASLLTGLVAVLLLVAILLR